MIQEPITAAALAAIIAAKAAEEFGSRIGTEISNGVFGRSKDFTELKKMLKQLDAKVDELLFYAKETYKLVKNLDYVIRTEINNNSLYDAHNAFKSATQLFDLIPEWNNTISDSKMQKLIESWNRIIDYEYRVDEIAKLPSYAEFLLSTTNGRFIEAAKAGIEAKINMFQGALEIIKSQEITPRILEVERIINSEYIKKGVILDKSPWAEWIIAEKKYIHGWIDCHTLPAQTLVNSSSTYFLCGPSIKEDRPFNNQLDVQNNTLKRLTTEINSIVPKLITNQIGISLLKPYFNSLNIRESSFNKLPDLIIED